LTTQRSTWARTTARLGLTAVLLAYAPGARAQPAGSAMDDEARRLYDEARKAKDKNDYATCTAKMRAAWALKKHRQVAGLLGECELKTGAHRDAAEHLGYFLDRSADAAPEVVAVVQALYDQARAEVAVVTVKASAVDADRKVDGKQLAPDERRVFLAPGEHVFSASKAGGGAAEKRIFVAAGQEREVMLELDAAKEAAPAPAPAPATPPPTQPSTEAESGPSMVPGIVAGGVGLVGVGVGIALLAASGSAGSDADEIAQGIAADGGECPPPPGFEARCADFDSAAGDEATLGTIGVISLIGGGILLAGGVGWTVWAATSSDEPDTASHITITPRVGLGGASLGASGTF
jgi:hypothetical protein